jgi:hydroxymethylglutaryl-CoA lyase
VTLGLPPRVTVVEVGPRDGLQSLGQWVPTATKVRMIHRLAAAGFPVVEVTAFARPDVIPDLRDAEAVVAGLSPRAGVVYRALAPNARGAERAVAAGVAEIGGLVTVSEEYTRRNQNTTVDGAVDQAVRAGEVAASAGAGYVVAVGMAMFCPYEGRIPVARTLAVTGRLWDGGVRRFTIAGSMGMEDPRQVDELFGAVRAEWPDAEVGYHVHNLAGMGTANVLAALGAGASSVEGSIAGIGGGIAMPHGVGSVGNIASEDLVHMLNEMGVETGIDTGEAVRAAREVAAMLGIEPGSYASRSGTRADVLRAGRERPREHPG